MHCPSFVMRGLDPRIHDAIPGTHAVLIFPAAFLMDCRDIGERSDAVLRPATPGNDDWDPLIPAQAGIQSKGM